jgi:HAD superfamily, subfamily IIIB (Acid phosphatase)
VSTGPPSEISPASRIVGAFFGTCATYRNILPRPIAGAFFLNASPVTIVFAITALAISSSIGLAADCPTPPPNHIPAAPTSELNIDSIKSLLLEYHQNYYDLDVEVVFETVQNYLQRNAGLSKRPAVVLDIDETALTNWPNLIADNLGFIEAGSCDTLPAGPCGFNQWILKASAKAVDPAVKLFKDAIANGIAVIFITARRAQQRDATVLNLDHAGFAGWTELRTRPDRDDLPTVQAFKTAERIKVEAEGYTIIANVGDQAAMFFFK